MGTESRSYGRGRRRLAGSRDVVGGRLLQLIGDPLRLSRVRTGLALGLFAEVDRLTLDAVDDGVEADLVRGARGVAANRLAA